MSHFKLEPAHQYVITHVKNSDFGYRTPPSRYWGVFKEAFFVMEEERKELSRIANDGEATTRVAQIARFKVTPEIRAAYSTLIAEYGIDKGLKLKSQMAELNEIAKHEQLKVLQPLIYADPKLVQTMDINHLISRASLGSLSPTYTLYFSAAPKNSEPDLQVTFDKPTGPWNYLTGPKKSLPNPDDRMKYVADIATKFNLLMATRRIYMESELQTIRGWINA